MIFMPEILNAQQRFRKFLMVLGSKLTHYPLEGRFSREAGILYS